MSNPRADFNPIINRKPLKLPDNARVAVWFIINIEDWDFSSPMARSILPQPQGVNLIPDVTNFGWFEYGHRIGFWRMKEILDRYGIKATISLNAIVCRSYPQIVEESIKSGWEIMAHGYIQRVLNLEEDERDIIRKAIKLIKEKTGKPPRGWLGPGLAENFSTPDVLAEEGIEYVGDWCNDDQPYPLKVKNGTLYSIPYTLELNDLPMYVVQHHRSAELYERSRDHFDTLYREGATNARVMAIATHPFVTGVPHRIGYFEKIIEYLNSHEGVLFMTGSEILDWYKSVID